MPSLKTKSKDVLRFEDHLKTEDNLKIEDSLKKGDNLKKEDNLKSKYDLKNEDNLMYYQKYLLKTPQLDSNNTSDPNRKFNWLSKTKIEFGLMEEMYATLCTYICEE